MKETIFSIFLIIHIAGGAIGLTTGMIVLGTAKGRKLHKILGKLFIYGMMAAGSSSLILSVLHPSSFLFMIGIFTLYMVGTGFRIIQTKSSNPAPNLFDRALQAGMGISGIILIVLGGLMLARQDFFGIVFVVFGGIGLSMMINDLKQIGKPEPDKLAYVRKHLQRLLGAFIASLTAFLVVNIQYFPDAFPAWMFWLLPTVIVTPLINYWSKMYMVKKEKVA